MTSTLPAALSTRRRRSIVTVFAVAATLLVVPTPAQAAPEAPVPLAAAASNGGLVGLQLGDHGSAVKRLQRKLQQTGLYLAGGADGVFGPGTRSAVTMFQSWNGLQQTGSVTEATAFWLKRATSGSGASSGSSSAGSGSGGSGGASGISSGGGTPTSPSASKLAGLRQGDSGTAVKRLQAKLIKAGVPVTGGADGVFGPATHSAVASFQGWNGLRVTGVVSKATARAIRAAARANSGGGSSTGGGSSGGGSSTATRYIGMKQGDRGALVKELQVALMETGLSLLGGADGVFGPATTSTLKLFQKVNGLKQNGTVSKKTARYLGLGSSQSGVVGTTGYAKYGEVGSRVIALQKALIASGIWVPGGADGVFGGSTAGAVMEFQRRQGLAVTGKVDSRTASKLKLAAAPAPSAPSAANVDMDVFPVQGLCWFADTWLAPRGDGRTHQGVDVIADKGKRLYAAVDGVVSKVYKNYPGSRAGNGLRVEQRDGTYFTYLHLSRFKKGVGLGSPVKAGDVVGFVGSTGNSATPHLHFEIHPYGGAAVNPYPLMKAIDDCRNTSPTR